MYNISKDRSTIWKELKQGYLGIIQWALFPEASVRDSLLRALAETETEARAEALSVAVSTACNCIGQLGLHQIAADEADSPHLEPQDFRWSPLRVLPSDTLTSITTAIAENDEFVALQQKVLAKLIAAVRVDALHAARDVMGIAGSSQMLQMLLALLGSKLGSILVERNETFFSVLGEVSRINSGEDAPLYTFKRASRDLSVYGTDLNSLHKLK